MLLGADSTTNTKLEAGRPWQPPWRSPSCLELTRDRSSALPCPALPRCLQLSTKMLDKGDLRDSLKLVYDFHNRFGEWRMRTRYLAADAILCVAEAAAGDQCRRHADLKK